MTAHSRPPRRNAAAVDVVSLEVPSRNVADVLRHLRSCVLEVLESVGIRLNDPDELVYQPVLPDSNAGGHEALTVLLKAPLTGRIVATWDTVTTLTPKVNFFFFPHLLGPDPETAQMLHVVGASAQQVEIQPYEPETNPPVINDRGQLHDEEVGKQARSIQLD